MNYLGRWLWHCEKVSRDEILPSDALLCQLMYHYDLDQSVMIYTPMLLCWGLLLYKNHHPLYVAIHEVRNVHHTYPCEVHQQTNMVREKTSIPALTTKILNDELHQRCILIPQESEWKNSAQVTHISSFNVWLIVKFLQQLTFVPFLSYIWDAGGLSNSHW